MDIDDFEEDRLPDRFYDEQLRLGWLDRRCKLKRSGFSEEELKIAVEVSGKLRRQRERTFRSMSDERLELAQEALFRKLRRGFGPKKVLTTKY